MRATTRMNRTTDARTMTSRSTSPRRISPTISTVGAMSVANVRSARRIGQRRGPGQGGGREGRRGGGGRLRQLAHRRVQRRGAPEEVEADPADVEDDLAVVGAV